MILIVKWNETPVNIKQQAEIFMHFIQGVCWLPLLHTGCAEILSYCSFGYIQFIEIFLGPVWCRNVVLIILGIIFFYLQRSHVNLPIAMQLCKSQYHDTLRAMEEAGRGASIATLPYEIIVPSSISVGTAREEAQNAATKPQAHTSGKRPSYCRI